jgi:hypothetical protein
MTIRAGSKWPIVISVCLLGGMAGALVSIPITWLGKVVTGAPPATMANYVWNMRAFGIMGAVIGPAVMISALPRVPLWRAVTAPMVACVLGALTGAILGSGYLFLALPVLGITLATWRLNYAWREPRVLIEHHDDLPELPGP